MSEGFVIRRIENVRIIVVQVNVKVFLIKKLQLKVSHIAIKFH